MARYRLATRSPWVFHHVTTRRTYTAGQRIASARDAFKRAARAARLPATFRMHDLRHRRVTTWLAEGHSPALVERAMGHANIATTISYYRFVKSHLLALTKPAQHAPPEPAALS